MPAQTHDVIYYSHNKTYYIYIYIRGTKNRTALIISSVGSKDTQL